MGVAALSLSGTTITGEDGIGGSLLMLIGMNAVSFADTNSSSYVSAGEVGRAGGLLRKMGPATTLLTNIASGVDGEARVSSEIGLAALLLSGTTTAIGKDGTANLLLMVFVMAAVSFANTSSSSYVCAGEVGRAG